MVASASIVFVANSGASLLTRFATSRGKQQLAGRSSTLNVGMSLRRRSKGIRGPYGYLQLTVKNPVEQLTSTRAQ
jgi:hypothetical protein